MLDIKIVTGESGDWMGLYIDDELAISGHNISIEDLLKSTENKLPINYDVGLEISNDDLERIGGTLPTRIDGGNIDLFY